MSLLFTNACIKPKTSFLYGFRLQKTKLFFLTMILFLLTTVSIQAQFSTSGPTRPPGVDEGIHPVTRAQVIIPDVPYYIWHHGCGPTALGMVIGYYDGQGHRFLVEGDASGQTSGANKMMAEDNGNTDCGNTSYLDHYHDYSCPIDHFASILPDKSELGGAHENNCVADFMKTSQSVFGMPYGWSWDSYIPISFTDYINYVAPQYTTSTTQNVFGEITWEDYKAEIDANRPVIFLVDIDADGGTDHFITGMGYEEDAGTNYYGCHDTWDESIHWFQWREIASGISWGIYSMTRFSCSYTPKIIHVSAEYASIGAAIEAADEGDTILVADGIHSGPGNRDIVLEGKPIILSENGPDVTIIDCGGSESEPHQGFIIESGFGSETKIDGLTIRNAYSPGIGGAIKCANSSLIISNCIFENNYALRGGGISIYGSSPIITNCTFRQNSGTEGGAMYFGNYTTPTIDECIIENNTAVYGGGAYSNLSEPLVQYSLFSGNEANNGGGYYNKMLGGTIVNCNFCMNSSSNGAAIHLTHHTSSLVIENSIIAFNTQGEAVYCADIDKTPSLNCTDIYGNEGGDWTGGIEDQQILNNNFSADPIFCNMVSGDYSLYHTSPCTPANSGCGTLVGFEDEECLILYTCGDINNDEAVNILDIVYLINYKYKDGPAPMYLNSADVNSDLNIDILDIVYLLNYRYKSGPPPFCL